MIGTVTPPRSDMLDMWVIYRRPSDYPDHYVARLWLAGASTLTFALADTLGELQAALIEAGRIKLDRDRNDDNVIVETWL